MKHPTHASRWSLAFGCALFVICAASVALVAAQSRAAFGLVQHTFEVGSTLDAMQIQAMRAEISRRGFVLTGDPEQLAPFERSRKAALSRLHVLESMTSDNSLQGRNLFELKAALADRFDSMQHAIALRRSGQLADATSLTASRAGKNGISRVIRAIDAVRSEERRLLVLRQENVTRLQGLVAGSGLLSALVLLVLASLIVRERRIQIRSLEKANRKLESDMALRRRAEVELELLADNATDAVLRFGSDGTCLYASPSARETFGVPPEAIIGRALSTLVDPEDRPAVETGLARLMSGSTLRETLTCRQGRSTCSTPTRWLEASTRVIVEGSGATPRGLIAAVRDVTGRKQLEIALEAAKDRAEIAAKAKASFLANMSHEIRTPMNGVLGLTDLLLSSSPSSEQRRLLELIADSGRAMMNLLNDVLDLAKIDAGQMRIAEEPVDIREKLIRCSGLMAPSADQKGIVLRVDVSPAVPTQVVGDPLRIRQVLLNLLGNAIKFTASGSVTLRADVRGGALTIDVEDTGIGIPADRLNDIFKEFAQADTTTARQFGGTGLGLSVCSNLARLMGGELTAQSVEGRGSIFRLTLPLSVALQDTQAIPGEPSREMAPLPDRPRVLIAEDHDINQILIMEVASRIGLDATLVADGSEAVASVKRAAASGMPFELVLMDMQMPILDGLGATRQLRAEGFSPETLPIVALTANAFPDDVEACLLAGMQAHISKPLRAGDLGEVVHRFLRSRSSPVRTGAVADSKLRARFSARTAETLQALENIATPGIVDAEDIALVVDGLHKIAGTAALFGRERLGRLAAELERNVVEWATANRIDLIDKAAEEIRKAA